MSGLDPDNDVFVFESHLRRDLWIHVVNILFGHICGHAHSHEIQQLKHSVSCAVDDAKPKIFEISPAGASCINHGRRAGSKAESVWQNATVSGPGARHPRGCIEVSMEVDES